MWRTEMTWRVEIQDHDIIETKILRDALDMAKDVIIRRRFDSETTWTITIKYIGEMK